MKTKPRILVFNSGSGSGFQELVENLLTGVLNAEIVGLITNNEKYACIQRAEKFGIPFVVMNEFKTCNYQTIIRYFQPDFVSLSGWLKKVPIDVFDSKKTTNIHPCILPDFGGPGMYGHHVHEAAIQAYKKGEIQHTEVCMHFVTDEYDKGPVFFRYRIYIRPDDTADTLGARVNKIEHAWQSYITNLVVNGEIYWDGKNPDSLVVPDWIRKNFL
jgi:folate-dependent phosphoribosylglycinamide formyltransferase PurN